MNISIVEVIQLMLAPGIMISACGLLLLGMNNKYSLVVGRTRALTDERRRLLAKAAGRDLTNEDNLRLESISVQLSRLIYRVKIVRNAVLCYTVAVALFVLTSLAIGAQFVFGLDRLNYTITILFLAGMVSVLTGVSYAAYETRKGFEIIQYEVKIDE
jgi:VIT1/CCC1 family predicted Fe2+/Mn2+ transporter